MVVSHYFIFLLFFLCAGGQQLRVAVIQDEPVFFQLSNGSFAGIAHDTFLGVLQVLQNKFNRTIIPSYVFVDSLLDLANLLVENQAGIFPTFLPSLTFLILL